MASGPDDVFDACEEIRQVCLTALADTPAGAPACSYITSGPPPWDITECLIVYTSGPALADTSPLGPSLSSGHRVQKYGEVNLLPITIAILRCAWQAPDDAPFSLDPDGITTVAKQTSADLWAIWNHLRAAKRSGALFPPVDREFFLDPCVPINQQGGAAGWQINVRTELGGYPVGGV